MFITKTLSKSYSNTALFLIWIWTSFLLSTLFSNDILINLLIINLVDDANQNQFIVLVWKRVNEAFKISAIIQQNTIHWKTAIL